MSKEVFGGLKVLMISSDRNIFSPDSAVSERMKEYGSLVEELHIVVLSTKAHGLKELKLSDNVWAYPTNSSAKLLYSKGAADLGRRIVIDKKFVRGRSVITAQDPFECGLAAREVKKKWRLPLEIQLHTDPFSTYFTGTLNTLRKSMAKSVLLEADSIRVVSEQLKENIASQLKIENWELKINTLPIYVDKERIKESQIAFDVHARFGWNFVILAVARLAPEKNISLAIETLARVQAQFPDTGLVIVGEGPEESRLRALAKKLGVERHIAFEGWQDKLASYYKTSSVFIQTSHFEGYGMALVEAGLSGLPVVSTPVGMATELDNGKDLYVCAHGDAEAFAAAVLDLLQNNFKRENLRVNMKNALESKLLSKEEYLSKLQKNWEETAQRVKV